ncbi:MAG: methyltransferase domain-containing protein [Anaerovoracaceae bacterium]
MSIFRPGEFNITEKAMELCAFKEGARLLEIGSGEGDTGAHLMKKYGVTVEGLELDLEKIRISKEKHPEVSVKYGDGEFLEDFSSFSMDGVIMECVLSLINLPDEALHEAYCVLKKGGKLFISDLYIKNPDEKQIQAAKIEAERMAKIPHESNSCSEDCAEEHKKRAVNFRIGTSFLKDPLIEYLEEVGFQVEFWEDRSADLDTFVAERILNGESLEGCKAEKGTGYFMLIAKKPE